VSPLSRGQINATTIRFVDLTSGELEQLLKGATVDIGVQGSRHEKVAGLALLDTEVGQVARRSL
jgi:hypothetical protein